MHMRKFVIFFAALLLGAGAYALPLSSFDRVEFAIAVGAGETLPVGTTTLSQAFQQAYGFMDFEYRAGQKHITYLDTPDRALRANNIQLRVRRNVFSPDKTKITVKIAADTPEGVGNLRGYTKAEIDTDGQKERFSVSYDIAYAPHELNVTAVDIDKVIAMIQKDRNAWGAIKDVVEANRAQLQQTIPMRSFDWSAYPKDSRFRNVEVDFQMWTTLSGEPGIAFYELSWKGPTRNRALLQDLLEHLKEQVETTGFSDRALTGSKTQATFDLSPDFNK